MALYWIIAVSFAGGFMSLLLASIIFKNANAALANNLVSSANRVPTAKLTKLFAKAALAFLKMILARRRLINPPANETAMIQYRAIVYP